MVNNKFEIFNPKSKEVLPITEYEKSVLFKNDYTDDDFGKERDAEDYRSLEEKFNQSFCDKYVGQKVDEFFNNRLECYFKDGYKVILEFLSINKSGLIEMSEVLAETLAGEKGKKIIKRCEKEAMNSVRDSIVTMEGYDEFKGRSGPDCFETNVMFIASFFIDILVFILHKDYGYNEHKMNDARRFQVVIN